MLKLESGPFSRSSGKAAPSHSIRILKVLTAPPYRKFFRPDAVRVEIDIMPALPKARTGKIMWRVRKELGQDEGDISTLVD